MVIGTAVSKPLWSTIIDNDMYSIPEINAQYLDAYHDTRSSYYIYNVLAYMCERFILYN